MGGMGGMGLVLLCVRDTGLVWSSFYKLINSKSFYGIVQPVCMSLPVYHEAPFVL